MALIQMAEQGNIIAGFGPQYKAKKLIICFSGTFLENDAGGQLFIFNFF